MTDTAVQGYTIADLEALPSEPPFDGRRYELLGGSIIMSPSPTPRHQLASFRLTKLLDDAVPPGHTVFHAPIELDLPSEQRVVPDIVVVPNTSILEKRLALPVLLLVELVSPSSVLYDLNVKREAYAAAGIDHYWVLDTRPGHERFLAHARSADGDLTVVTTSTEMISVTEPLPISVTLADLLTVSDR